jgi:hypothetical protein
VVWYLKDHRTVGQAWSYPRPSAFIRGLQLPVANSDLVGAAATFRYLQAI